MKFFEKNVKATDKQEKLKEGFIPIVSESGKTYYVKAEGAAKANMEPLYKQAEHNIQSYRP